MALGDTNWRLLKHCNIFDIVTYSIYYLLYWLFIGNAFEPLTSARTVCLNKIDMLNEVKYRPTNFHPLQFKVFGKRLRLPTSKRNVRSFRLVSKTPLINKFLYSKFRRCLCDKWLAYIFEASSSTVVTSVNKKSSVD